MVLVEVTVNSWFRSPVCPGVQLQICIFVPEVVEPPVTSRQNAFAITSVFLTTAHCWLTEPEEHGSTTTAAPFAWLEAVRQVVLLEPGRIVFPVPVGPVGALVVVVVPVGPLVLVEKTGVPVSQAIEPPHAAPGSGVPSQVQLDDCVWGTPMAWYGCTPKQSARVTSLKPWLWKRLMAKGTSVDAVVSSVSCSKTSAFVTLAEMMSL